MTSKGVDNNECTTGKQEMNGFRKSSNECKKMQEKARGSSLFKPLLVGKQEQCSNPKLFAY
jgi:hypothetical protein